MRTALMVGVAAVAMAVTAETVQPWIFDDSGRAALVTAPTVGAQTVAAAWTCPAWVEAYVSGIRRYGFVLLYK